MRLGSDLSSPNTRQRTTTEQYLMPTVVMPGQGPAAPTVSPQASESSTFSAPERLRSDFAAARVSFTWLGVRKALTPEQRERAAESFGAERTFLSAGKKLLDTRHKRFRAVTAVRSRAQGYWRCQSCPYPEPGVRLIRKDAIQPFARQMEQFRAELESAVEELDRDYDGLKAFARERLGTLYDPADYPQTLRGLFEVSWDFPSVEPPDYLLKLSPQLYEQERRRIASRFDEAVRLAEEAFTAEFSELVSHLVERLSTGPGEPKRVFRDSAVENLSEFFDRFRRLNVHSSAELDELVETARRAVRGAEPQAVRDNESLRHSVAHQLTDVRSKLDKLMVDLTRRRILRPAGKEVV